MEPLDPSDNNSLLTMDPSDSHLLLTAKPLEPSDSHLLEPVDKLIMKNSFPGEKDLGLLEIEPEFRVSKHKVIPLW